MKATRTKTIAPPFAVKATRGTAELWVAGQRFGTGNAPNVKTIPHGLHVLPAVVAALAAEGFTTRITWFKE